MNTSVRVEYKRICISLQSSAIFLPKSFFWATLCAMNISELARRLRVSTEELRSKLPELGFDIGGKAIKIPDRDAGRIMNAWQEYKKRQYLQKKMEDQKAQLALKEKVKAGDAPRVKVPATLTVREFATILNLPIAKVMQELMKAGILASLNERIDFETAVIVAEDLGFIAEQEGTSEEIIDAHAANRLAAVKEEEAKHADGLVARPPVGASSTCNYCDGSCRPRKDVDFGYHSQDARDRHRSRRNYAAHRCISGGKEWEGAHVY